MNRLKVKLLIKFQLGEMLWILMISTTLRFQHLYNTRHLILSKNHSSCSRKQKNNLVFRNNMKLKY